MALATNAEAVSRLDGLARELDLAPRSKPGGARPLFVRQSVLPDALDRRGCRADTLQG